MKIFKLFLVVLGGVFLISAPVFAAGEFETSPTSALLNETNLAPGDQVTRTLTLKNNTTFDQTVKFKPINYNDPSTPLLGDVVYVEIKDGSNIIYSKNTLSNFKNAEITTTLSPGIKDLDFEVSLDNSIGNEYQGLSLTMDLLFNAEWDGGATTTTLPGGIVLGEMIENNPAANQNIVGKILGATTGGSPVLYILISLFISTFLYFAYHQITKKRKEEVGN